MLNTLRISGLQRHHLLFCCLKTWTIYYYTALLSLIWLFWCQPDKKKKRMRIKIIYKNINYYIKRRKITMVNPYKKKHFKFLFIKSVFATRNLTAMFNHMVHCLQRKMSFEADCWLHRMNPLHSAFYLSVWNLCGFLQVYTYRYAPINDLLTFAISSKPFAAHWYIYILHTKSGRMRFTLVFIRKKVFSVSFIILFTRSGIAALSAATTASDTVAKWKAAADYTHTHIKIC